MDSTKRTADPDPGKRPKLSTRSLGTGFASALGVVAGLGLAAPPAGALLPNRVQYWGATSNSQLGRCTDPGYPHSGTPRTPNAMYNYGRATNPCGPGGGGYTRTEINLAYGGPTQVGPNYGGPSAAASSTLYSINKAATVQDQVKLRSAPYDTVHHILEGVSRRSF